ncbi:hypothetical protein [Maridesulfovibrio ferrireducens]|uniref:hypothetical protein n=1 Tax=Maridesulfovibrio ferrireducens TaxID=246191 RepID=UPI001A290005|nr:hypothetical protein [Maridesulfovibrio ferrireducens]MBI9111814.1 hypothetical protein [Maridesulfovibrio ferrireducens]
MPSYSEGFHEYYYELIETALTDAGHEVVIEGVVDLPHLRELRMLGRGCLDILWLVRTPELDKMYIPIPVPLTNGLFGKRVLLVPAEDLNAYKDVKTLQDFCKLNKVGGLGSNCFDAGVWKENKLPCQEVANWRCLYNMIAMRSRGLDYFSRGFNEVIDDVKAHDVLVIEPHLLLEYNRDVVFYLSPKKAHLKPIIEEALLCAKCSGLLDKLIRKYWADNFEILKPEGRTVIKLKDIQKL